MLKKILKSVCKKIKFDPWEISAKIKSIEALLLKSIPDGNHLYSVMLDGSIYGFYDSLKSSTVQNVAAEIGKGAYDFSRIKFAEGDCIIDIGGNVGMISIYLAKKYPFLKIYAFEPVKENYENFLANIKLNAIPDNTIVVENKAVTKDGRQVALLIDKANMGGSQTIQASNHNKSVSLVNERIDSTTLEDIFSKYKINRCKLLKIDCEGSEYEIIYNTPAKTLKKCQYLRGEFHGGGGMYKLQKYCRKYISDVKVEYCWD